MQSSSRNVTTKKPTTSFLQAGRPSRHQTNSVKTTEGKFETHTVHVKPHPYSEFTTAPKTFPGLRCNLSLYICHITGCVCNGTSPRSIPGHGIKQPPWLLHHWHCEPVKLSHHLSTCDRHIRVSQLACEQMSRLQRHSTTHHISTISRHKLLGNTSPGFGTYG